MLFVVFPQGNSENKKIVPFFITYNQIKWKHTDNYTFVSQLHSADDVPCSKVRPRIKKIKMSKLFRVGAFKMRSCYKTKISKWIEKNNKSTFLRIKERARNIPFIIGHSQQEKDSVLLCKVSRQVPASASCSAAWLIESFTRNGRAWVPPCLRASVVLSSFARPFEAPKPFPRVTRAFVLSFYMLAAPW